MRISILILSCITILGCNKYEIKKNSVLIFGHGGMGFDNLNGQFAPNSVASITKALDFYDLDGVEVDIQFTQDGNLIVFHDNYLENSTQCKGLVNSLNFNEIGDCYYRKQFSNQYTETVISFDSLIRLINTNWNQKLFSLNIKNNFNVPFKIDSLGGILNKKLQNLYSTSNIIIECNDANLLFALKLRNDYKCMLVSDLDSIGAKDVIRFELDGIVSNFNNININSRQELLNSEKKIIIYGQKSINDYKTLNYKDVYGIQIDNPIAALRYFRY
ncbi:MAG: glycerophosphodiester phosphodiesterase family protein [Bacteroidia bacterium]|nr:glycerophosphodiester phosphodiesterase family protein [Bacteroidia bacterium]